MGCSGVINHGGLIRKSGAESDGDIRGREAFRFANRNPGKEIPVRSLVAAAKPGNTACKVLSQDVFGGRAADFAVIDAEVEFLAAFAQGKSKVVADEPATITHEGEFAIESTNGIAPADGDAILRDKGRMVILAALVGCVGDALFAKREWHGKLCAGKGDFRT